MREVQLPNGQKVAALGQGTWRMGEVPSARAAEVRALRQGLDLGLTLIDTAEMYGEGGAEEVVAEAIAGRRDDVFLVSKVYPHNAGFDGALRACARSLKRLGTDRIDLYLLHWRGAYPLAETVRAFERLQADGKIRHWGVSNFDTDDMEELWDLAGGSACAANQVLYNVAVRGPEWDLMPKLKAKDVPLMAYSPVQQGSLRAGTALDAVAERHGVDAYAVALAWLLAHGGVIAIPKAVRPDHVMANAKALELRLSADDLALIDRDFPPPSQKEPLALN
ncbi:MAG: aldo/keto reductase [Geminicoccaceae bacterium]|nr:MAG: aldo/keto reductase [Geminicoccaceae bacterium]